MSVIEDLERILADEQTRLLTGDYSGLADLADRKTMLAERLEHAAPTLDVGACKRLADKAAHNETLLRSAQRGIQAAMTQLDQFTNGEHQSTYSKGGQRRALSPNPSSIIQKL